MKPKNKILIVVQRYGAEVNGGSEVLAREWATRLTKRYAVTVATTCAKDDMTWTDYYPSGESQDGDVKLRRFPVDRSRNFEAFCHVSARICTHPLSHDESDIENWMFQQGPISSTLFQYLVTQSHKFDCVIFFTYLYATTAFGIRCIPDNIPVILVPTAHEEPPIYVPIFEDVFNRPNLITCCTEPEQKICHKHFPKIKKSTLVGCGIEGVFENSNHNESSNAPYLLYVGRIAHGKGMAQLFDYYLKLPEMLKMPFYLVGTVQMECPQHPNIKYLGYISESEKIKYIQNASVMLVPSLYESLSLSTLESWALKTPVIVNGGCEVLVDHVTKSNGGLIYREYFEFKNCINYILNFPKQTKMMGRQGFAYTKTNYTWPVVEQKLFDTIQSVISMS